MVNGVDGGVLWSFLLLWLVIVPTPGANSLMVTHTALTRPGAHVAFAIVGNVAGVLVLGAGALLGWSALLERVPWLRIAVHVLGGIYLIYFGWRLLARARRPLPVAAGEGSPQTAGTEPLRAVGLGFATALSNAQAILFITSIFAVSGVLGASRTTGLIVLAIMGICNLSYLGLLGWMFRRAVVRRRYQAFRRPFEAVIGCVFCVFGARLALREFVALL